MTGKATSDGLSASYYELPEGATELYHLIIHRDMNAQLGEIFRAAYRYGQASHSDQLRDINKIITYANQEKERLLKQQRFPVELQLRQDDPDHEYIIYDDGSEDKVARYKLPPGKSERATISV
jgi:hypothetical protein